MAAQAIRICDVINLGEPSLIIDTEDETLVLLDATLTCEQRIDILNDVMRTSA